MPAQCSLHQLQMLLQLQALPSMHTFFYCTIIKSPGTSAACYSFVLGRASFHPAHKRILLTEAIRTSKDSWRMSTVIEKASLRQQ